MDLDIFAFTSQGGRENNEDFVGYTLTGDGVVAVLCDGLGGEKGGEIASRVCVEAILDEPYSADDGRRWLDERLRLADNKLREQQRRLNNSMKTTVAALRIDGEAAAWAHAGDSRLYYIHNSAISEVTADHSVAFKKYLSGRIGRNEIARDADRDSLLNCVGGEGFSPEFGVARIEKGDGFVLCCDGIWQNLYDQEIVFDYLKADTAERWAELLALRVVDCMDSTGDNVSIITVLVK